jgi:hypothetical protein
MKGDDCKMKCGSSTLAGDDSTSNHDEPKPNHVALSSESVSDEAADISAFSARFRLSFPFISMSWVEFGCLAQIPRV